MRIAIEALIAYIIFNIGVTVGFFVKKWLLYRSSYDGAILIIRDGDKILYSIELHEEPETIEFKNELILKVKPLP